MIDSNLSNSQTYNKFFSPVSDIISSCNHFRNCPELTDEQWIQMGVCRSVMEPATGRGFLQRFNPYFQKEVEITHFFNTLKSQRRLNLCEEINQRICQRIQQILPDPLAQYQELKKFDLHAGDGHWHGAASHDKAKDGRKWAVGHFYTLNLRNHAMRHLEMADGVHRKHEHDMRALKRQSLADLRQGAAQGRKVLYLWDSACLDFERWDYWKRQGGVYFVTRFKENLDYLFLQDNEMDRDDPVNHGVISDQLIMAGGNKTMRRIECADPATGQVHVFLTNEMTLSAGLLAQLYRMRWDVEKVFDQFKNALEERKAWASSQTAKTMQANFLCLAHNLMLLLDHELEQTFSVVNQAEIQRRKDRLQNMMESAAKAGRQVSDVYHRVQRLTKRSLKFIRTLRTYLYLHAPLRIVAEYLNRLYATL